jgi:hypothetical protein
LEISESCVDDDDDDDDDDVRCWWLVRAGCGIGGGGVCVGDAAGRCLVGS